MIFIPIYDVKFHTSHTIATMQYLNGSVFVRLCCPVISHMCPCVSFILTVSIP